MMSRNVTQIVLTPVAACAARCRRMLGALARVGKRRMGRLAPSSGVAVAASSFSRMAQAVRLLTLLELKLRVLLARGVSAPIPALVAAVPAPPQGERRHTPEDTPREASLDRPERPERPERLDRETFPRLDLDRMRLEDGPSLTELVADICRGLGLSREATLRAQAPFAALEALLAGKPPPAPPKRRPSMDRARPRAPLPVTADPPDAKRAHVDARGPEWPP